MIDRSTRLLKTSRHTLPGGRGSGTFCEPITRILSRAHKQGLPGVVQLRLQLRMRAAVLYGCVVLLSLPIAGCFTTQAKIAPRLFYPPPVAMPVIPSQAILQPETSVAFEAPANPWEMVTLELPQLPGPPKPPVVRTPQPVKTTGPAAPAPAPPRIVQQFSPDQTQKYNKEYDDSQDRVKRDLAILEKKSLTPAQRRAMERIVTFQRQAEQEKERDLVTAVNLARRAAALSADLMTRIQ